MPVSQRRTRIVGRLRRRKTRAREGLVLVEGVRASAEALDAGADARFAVVSERLRDTPEGSALLARLLRDVGDVDDVADAELEALADTDTPQGVLLVCAEPSGAAVPERPGRWLVLDALQDPGNAGTLVRAAVAFGLDGVVALDGTVDPWAAKTVRASAGMAFRIPVLAMTADQAVDRFRGLGVPLLVADAEGRDVAAWDAPPPWALVVGNEGRGPRESVRAAAAATLRIPMPGPAESLNAGVAGSILLYALTVTRRP